MIFGGWQYFNGNGRMISIRKRRMVPAPMKDSSCRFREFPIPGVLFIEDGILVSTATQACQKIDSHMPCATGTQSRVISENKGLPSAADIWLPRCTSILHEPSQSNTSPDQSRE